MAVLYGDLNKAGPYLVMMKWNPGWFSAPHNYRTDRICVVVSGTWLAIVVRHASSPSPLGRMLFPLSFV
jgi:hypothetical protein